MARISFNSAASESGAYTLTINPRSVVIPWADKEAIIDSHKTIDGESITFEQAFDSRRGKLVWTRMPGTTDTTLGSDFITQTETLVGYEGTKKYIHLRDIGDTLFGSLSNTWTYIKIISVNRVLSEGGEIFFKSVELIFEAAET